MKVTRQIAKSSFVPYEIVILVQSVEGHILVREHLTSPICLSMPHTCNERQEIENLLAKIEEACNATSQSPS